MRLSPLLLLCVSLAQGSALHAAPPEVVICQYNVRNYLGPPEPGVPHAAKAKPETEIAALVRVVQQINPDVLGVCEMGPPDRFEDFKARLAACGLGYIDFEYVQAVDTERHLALLSRFPLVARHSVADVSFEIDGRVEKVRRGFLDVTAQIAPGYQLRLVGAHLKSKLPAAEGEGLVRRYEAQELRRHLEAILQAEPGVRLVCYGDMNDSKSGPMFSAITGLRGGAGYMADLPARDETGERWTFYWKPSDEYTRIDYIFASPRLLREVVKEKCRVYRGPEWDIASDHRAVYASILPSGLP